MLLVTQPKAPVERSTGQSAPHRLTGTFYVQLKNTSFYGYICKLRVGYFIADKFSLRLEALFNYLLLSFNISSLRASLTDYEYFKYVCVTMYFMRL